MSRFEKRFGVKSRGPGRPPGVSAEDIVFVTVDKEDKELARQARQRTIALLIDQNRDYMRKVYEDEYRWLLARKSRVAG